MVVIVLPVAHLLGCGPKPNARGPEVPVIQLLSLEPGDGVHDEDPRHLVEHHDVLGEAELWVVQILNGGPENISKRDSRNRVPLDSKELTRLCLVGSFDLSLFQEVDVGLEVVGDDATAMIAVQCMVKTKVIARSVFIPIPAGARRMRIPIAPRKKNKTGADKLVLVLRGRGEVRVDTVDLYRTIELGPAHEESQFVSLGEESRRGIWLFSSQPRKATAFADEKSVLSFSYGVTPRLREVGGALRVTLLAVGGKPQARAFPFEKSTPIWNDRKIDLKSFAGKELDIRFELVGPSGEELACVLAEPTVFQRGEEKRTVLLVTSDTHRADHLGVADLGVEVQTPFLDGLAARGILFEDCLAPANITAPSHISLFTGVHLRDHHILNNRTPLSLKALTLAELFQKAGYATCASVSVTFLRPKVCGLGQGFDRVAFPGFLRSREAARTTEVVREWLPGFADRSLFVWIHLFDAHHPYDPPERFDLYYPKGKDPRDPSLPDHGIPDEILPREFRGIRDLSYASARYRGEITSLDAALGALVEKTRFGEGTIAFVADHGESFGERDIYFSHGGLYPPNLRIPLILSWPGGPHGVRDRRPVTHLDVGKTLLAISSLKSAEFPGTDLSAQSSWSPEAPPVVRFAIQAGGQAVALIKGKYHFVLHLRENHPIFGEHTNLMDSMELYDMVADPQCEKNLVEGEPKLTKQFRGDVIEWLKASVDLRWAGRGIDDPALIEKLAALGYLESEERGSREWWPEDKE